MNKDCCKKFFTPVALPCKASAALLFVRLVMGIAFLYHGWGKIQHPFSWMPEGSPVPGFFQFLAAISEFGGGIALILGVITSLAMLGLAFTMFVATYMHMFVMKDPFVATGPGMSSYEPALMYLALSILIMVIGPGKYSVDHK
ncbi:MAG: DoxX family protein, partial [Bdellovibrionales bacterium]|nr:DoxX family protein [Bdellovibrionales bacterium]